MGEAGSAYGGEVYVGKTEGKKPLRRFSRRSLV